MFYLGHVVASMLRGVLRSSVISARHLAAFLAIAFAVSLYIWLQNELSAFPSEGLFHDSKGVSLIWWA